MKNIRAAEAKSCRHSRSAYQEQEQQSTTSVWQKLKRKEWQSSYSPLACYTTNWAQSRKFQRQGSLNYLLPIKCLHVTLGDLREAQLIFFSRKVWVASMSKITGAAIRCSTASKPTCRGHHHPNHFMTPRVCPLVTLAVSSALNWSAWVRAGRTLLSFVSRNFTTMFLMYSMLSASAVLSL